MDVTALERRSIGIQPIPVGNGQWVTIRPIESSDWEGLLGFYRALSAEARYTRFLGMSPGIGIRAAHQFADARARRADGYVAILREARPADGRVVGHLCLEPMRQGAAEIAVAIADDVRRRGIGKRLMSVAMAAARSRGLTRLVATMFAGNDPMRRLFTGAGGQVICQSIDAGVESVELDPLDSMTAKGMREEARHDD
jgi:L-amino acid N-acyltransferase YncA